MTLHVQLVLLTAAVLLLQQTAHAAVPTLKCNETIELFSYGDLVPFTFDYAEYEHSNFECRFKFKTKRTDLGYQIEFAQMKLSTTRCFNPNPDSDIIDSTAKNNTTSPCCNYLTIIEGVYRPIKLSASTPICAYDTSTQPLPPAPKFIESNTFTLTLNINARAPETSLVLIIKPVQMTFTELEGQVASPLYQDVYLNNLNLNYAIKLDADRLTYIRVDAMELEGSGTDTCFDFVKISSLTADTNLKTKVLCDMSGEREFFLTY
jgi:hypothetical protein